MDPCVVHDEDTQISGKWCTERHLVQCMVYWDSASGSKLWHTTMNLRYSTNNARVIDPSTTMLATIPSIDNKPSAEKHRPRMKTPFMTAHVPLWECPRVLNAVRSSFETSSRNPSCSGKYWPIHAIKSAWRSSLCSEATFLIFFSEIPAWTSSRWTVVKCA